MIQWLARRLHPEHAESLPHPSLVEQVQQTRAATARMQEVLADLDAIDQLIGQQHDANNLRSGA